LLFGHFSRKALPGEFDRKLRRFFAEDFPGAPEFQFDGCGCIAADSLCGRAGILNDSLALGLCTLPRHRTNLIELAFEVDHAALPFRIGALGRRKLVGG